MTAPARTTRRLPPAIVRAVVPAAVAALALVAAACSGGDGTGGGAAAPPVTAPLGLPDGADLDDRDPVPEPGEDDCDATASLAPEGPLPAPGALPAGSAMAEIRERGHLRAGVDQSSYLAGYRDPLTGQLEGFDIDILREVSRAIFGEPDRIRFTIMTNSQRQRAVDDGDVDIVASIMTITCPRRYPERYLDDEAVEQFPGVEFSAVYFEAEQRILVPRGSPIEGPDDLGGHSVCVPVNTTVEQNLAHHELPAGSDPVSLVTVEGRSDCLALLQQGLVDAASTDETILAGFRAQDPTLEIVGESIHAQPYGLALAKDAPELTRFVNGVLEQMRADGRWQEIFDRWLADSGIDYAPPTPRYRD